MIKHRGKKSNSLSRRLILDRRTEKILRRNKEGRQDANER